MIIVGIIGTIVFMVLIIAGSIIYNDLVTVNKNIEKAWGNIDVLLKQRHDELPKLILICQGYMKYEKELLEKLTTLRGLYGNASRMPAVAGIDSIITGTLKSLFAVAEKYPDLKANEHFLNLQKRISILENQLADRREFYNDSVNIYNIRIHQIPDVFMAFFLNYRDKEMFKVSDRDVMNIDLNTLQLDIERELKSFDKKNIRNWLEMHTELLSSFDRNNDKRIDPDEIEEALSIVIRWAGLALHPDSMWRIYIKGKEIGPFSWQEVKTKIGDEKLTFILADGEQLWLPYIVIEIAIKAYQ